MCSMHSPAESGPCCLLRLQIEDFGKIQRWSEQKRISSFSATVKSARGRTELNVHPSRPPGLREILHAVLRAP